MLKHLTLKSILTNKILILFFLISPGHIEVQTYTMNYSICKLAVRYYDYTMTQQRECILHRGQLIFARCD
jgi:hypothetical protein